MSDLIEYYIGEKRLGPIELDDDLMNKRGFMLTNNRGSFFSLPIKGSNSSLYHGYYLKNKIEAKPFKFIETIRLKKTDEDYIKLVNKMWCTERHHGDTIERFFLPKGRDVLIYETEGTEGKTAELILDMRQIYDDEKWSRNHTIEHKGEYLLITYKNNHTIAVLAKGCEFKVIDNWLRADYMLDRSRKNGDGEWYVYHALDIRLSSGSMLLLGMGTSQDEAIKEIAAIKDKIDLIKSEQQRFYLDHIAKRYLENPTATKISLTKITKDELLFAKVFAHKAFDDLAVIEDVFGKEKFIGLYAGLWWFYQFWSRDESISCGALIKLGMYDQAKSILFRNIEIILPDGRIPNRFPSSEPGSADGVGWTFHRLGQFVDAFQDRISLVDMNHIKQKLWLSISRLQKSYLVNGLIRNRGLETWMDTSASGDDRKGSRIEIQALLLSMIDIMIKLCRLTDDVKRIAKYETLKEKVLTAVQVMFLHDDVIADGSDGDNIDLTVRPNAFMAHYIYPSLFRKETWITCFENMQDNIWCDWINGGGFATIDTKSFLFQPIYSGMDNISYHRGDSWFFMNNIIAVSMLSLDKQ
ncbi:hypothetical protein COT47_00170, partial [Candidatus Woesearchaeota archaeon CG08_land_8_20_14_0_20_43_7]